MATAKQIKKQIKSAGNIGKITKAMQMVAASKMKRAQDKAQAGRAYARGLEGFSRLLAQKTDPGLHPLLFRPPAPQEELVVVIAPEKGLCGGLVTNLARLVSEAGSAQAVKYLAVGKKAVNLLVRLGREVVAEFSLGFAQPDYDFVFPLTRLIRERFESGRVSRVSVIYAEFVNTMVQRPVQETLLPLELTAPDDTAPVNPADDYLFEPSPGRITESLLDNYLDLKLYQIILEAYASEQSARLVAMKNASDNARSLLQSLTQSYNKARQAGITAEITDIATASLVA